MANVSVEDILHEFDVFGEEVDNEQLLKLQELCRSYCISANSLVDQWMAFSTSRQVDLSLENINLFDREWLPKKLQSSQAKTPQSKRTSTHRWNKDSIDNDLEDQLEVIGAYTTPEEKNHIAQVAKRQLTPESLNFDSKRFVCSARSPSVQTLVHSPGPISSAVSTPSSKFSARSNAGDVILKFGDANDIAWIGESQGYRVSHFDSAAVITPHIKYMFQKLFEKACVLNESIQYMSALLKNAHGIEEFGSVTMSSQESVTVAGRICCDSIGHINSQSVLLEGSRETSSGKCIGLDLSDLKQYSLFPGQIIACEGVNITGKKFSVQQIYQAVPLPFPPVKNEQEDVGKLRLVIAAGPYSPSDCLDYSPLSDLLKYINRDKPDLCILMGPFVDTKNTTINSGFVEETFDEIFLKQMEEISHATQHLGCKVVIVSSSRDAHHSHCVYPQPPYSLPTHSPDGSKRLHSEVELTNNLMFISDPSTICVNGVVIGLTSTDILMHLSKSEISIGPKNGLDRMGRLAQHILNQHSYYPLYPPAEDVNVDYELWETYAHLPVTPHILLLPSDLKAFVKDISGCCVVNSGRLTTGFVGGTYAHMVIDTHVLSSSHTAPASACAARIIKV